MRRTISRRTVLKGMAAGGVVTVALPALEIMLNDHGDALSDGSPLPSRFMTFFFGNGVIWDRWIPTTQGPTYELSEQLAPLVNVKDYCAVLTGFENKIGPKITHHEGASGMLSGHPFVQPPEGGLYSSFGGPSIDQLLVPHIGDTFLKSIEIGVSKRVSENEGPTMQFISHQSTQQPLPPLYSPVDVWQRLFGNFVPPDDPSGDLRVSTLDAIAEDARRLQNIVGASDRERLDAHLTGVAELQAQIAALPPMCTTPGAPTERNVDDLGREPMPAVAKVMTDLLVYAFQCDITRIASYMLTGGVGYCVYSHLGHSEENHNMSHFPETYAEELNAAIVWNVEQYAYLLEQLKATADGARNLLDNSVVLLCSDCGEGWSHTTYDHPIVVAGGGNGRLRTGFHYRSPRADGGGFDWQSTSDILLACAQAAGAEVTEIGSREGYSNSPLSEILT